MYYRPLFLVALLTCGCGTPSQAPTESASTAATADHDGHDHDGHDAACSCKEGKAGGTVWCEACAKGYIKGQSTTDKAAVEKATAGAGHDGHDHDGHDAACSCKEGKAGGTMWCEACAKGYIKGQSTTDKAAVEKAVEGS